MRRREEKEKAAQGEAVRRAPGRLCTAAATGARRGAGSGFSTLGTRESHGHGLKPYTGSVSRASGQLCHPDAAAKPPNAGPRAPRLAAAPTARTRPTLPRGTKHRHFRTLKTPAPVPNTTCPALDGGLQEVGHPRRLLQPRRRKKPGTRTRIIEAGRMLYLGGAGGVRGNRVWLSDEEQQLRLQPGVGEICAYGQHALGAKARPRGR